MLPLTDGASVESLSTQGLKNISYVEMLDHMMHAYQLQNSTCI